MPYALAVLLPPGLLGLIVAAVLAAFISTNGTCLHSWGSIFVQDVILPFHRKPLSPKAHIRLLQLTIIGVAVFAFLFSVYIKPTQFLAMFFAITAAVFGGGAGAAIIGGLYWKRGTTYGAWAAMLSGMVLSLVGFLLKQTDAKTLAGLSDVVPRLGDVALFIRNHLTGQEQTFFVMCAATLIYVLVSLLGPRQITNMDKLLHRGRYARMRQARSAVEPAAVDEDHCRNCGYLLIGLTESRCPECGTDFTPRPAVVVAAVTKPTTHSDYPGWLERLGID